MAQEIKPLIDPINNIIYGNLNLEQKYFFKGYMEYPFNIESIGVTHPDKDYFITRSCSEYFVIEFVTEGKGYLTVDGKDYVLEKATFIFYRPKPDTAITPIPNSPTVKSGATFTVTLLPGYIPITI